MITFNLTVSFYSILERVTGNMHENAFFTYHKCPVFYYEMFHVSSISAIPTISKIH